VERHRISGAVPVAATEDILLSKLIWHRLGGEQSTIQQRDITALVALNRGELDEAYLRQWAMTLGASDLAARFV
jgi:hypothetical protein